MLTCGHIHSTLLPRHGVAEGMLSNINYQCLLFVVMTKICLKFLVYYAVIINIVSNAIKYQLLRYHFYIYTNNISTSILRPLSIVFE